MPVWDPPIEGWRLDDDAITRAKIANLAVGTAEIDDLAVSTAKIDALAVTAAEIADATITKLKIGDQEVDIQRMLDPIAWDTDRDTSQDVTLDTTWRDQASITFTVPSWAGEAMVSLFATIQVSLTSGDTLFIANVNFDDASAPSTGFSQDMLDGTTGHVQAHANTVIAAPGSTIVGRLWAKVSSGTSPQNLNNWALDGFVLYKR